ncbi:MAG: hypothetical protein WCL70_12405 [Paludibacter sp.]
MKKIIFIFLIMVLVSCEKNEMPVGYCQFTKDDLSHLNYNKDTLTFIGQKIVYKDTITYLLNGTDSIHVPIKTELDVFVSSLIDFPNVKKSIFGESLIVFTDKTGFEFADIRIYRTSDYGNADIYFQVSGFGNNAYSERYFVNDTATLDTALVLGKIYQNVYKFYPTVEGKTDIRLIYFAKKYGYIKIEKLDGTKIELIDRSK